MNCSSACGTSQTERTGARRCQQVRTCRLQHHRINDKVLQCEQHCIHLRELSVVVIGCHAQALSMSVLALPCTMLVQDCTAQDQGRMAHQGMRKDELLVVLRQARHCILLVFADGQQVLRGAAEAGPPARAA